ncbi:MAG: hypothetical protein CVU65_13680 [Deltaproteobacteria bacterium HGW-Deltaproteobacteria-22]|jgi:hypothetical protein|nr:MAG: hypothetical protein CVU65_13680 [Deltaproteobacteria bacterium HGW-Deltaproteobacteria-22]
MKSAILGWILPLVFMFSGCDSGTENNNNINNTSDIIETDNINVTDDIDNTNNTNNITIVPANENKTEAQAMAQLFPGATFEVATSASGDYYIVRDAQSAIIGYGVANANWGFNGEVRTLTGISAAGETLGLETITQRESWWYYVPLSFFSQFKGIPMENVTLLPGYDKNCSPRCTSVYSAIGVDAISGATYTSDAMIKNVMDGFLHWDEVLSAQ